MTLQLKGPDGYGFLYGELERDGERIRVNVLPPAGEWRGDRRLTGYEPDATAWIIFADGEEIARVSRREELEQLRLAPARRAWPRRLAGLLGWRR